MIRHTLIGVMVALGALAAVGGVSARARLSAPAAAGPKQVTIASLVPGSGVLLAGATAANPHAAHMQGCIADCRNCRRVCLKSIAYCRKMGGKHADPAHLRLLADCADICQTSANFMRRGSEFHADTCSLCTKVCQACEKSCAQFPNDAQMKACGAECRKCASSCQAMAGMKM
jgi:hypothetical protein